MSLSILSNLYSATLINIAITISNVKSIYSDMYNENKYAYLTQDNNLYYMTTHIADNVDSLIYFEYFKFNGTDAGQIVVYKDLYGYITQYTNGNTDNANQILSNIKSSLLDLIISYPTKHITQIVIRYFDILPAIDKIHIFILFNDGTCISSQSGYSINQINTWNNIIKLQVPYNPNGFTCGLTNTNSIIITNYSDTTFDAQSDVSVISNVKDVQFDIGTSIYQLTLNNTILYFGNNEYSQSNCESFSNIKQIKQTTNTVYGLTYSGNIVSQGQYPYSESNNNKISLDTYIKYDKYLYLFKQISDNHIITFKPEYTDLTVLYGITSPTDTDFLTYGINSTLDIDYAQLGEFKLLVFTHLPTPITLTMYALESNIQTSILSQPIPLKFISEIRSLTINYSKPENTDIRILLSFDDKQTWQYYNGNKFIDTTLDDIAIHGNSISEIQSLFTNYILDTNWQSFDICIALISYDQRYVPSVTSVNISYILDSQLRILLSNDTGNTWYGYYNNQFVPVDISNNKQIYKYGLTMSQLNTLHETNPNIWNEFLTWDNVLRFQFYLSENDPNDILELDILSMQVDIAGTWKLQSDSDYDYSFPQNNILRVTIYTDGSYKINYNVIDYTPPGDLKSFTQTTVAEGIKLTWTPPDDYDYQGVIIRKSTQAFPTNLGMGEFVYQGNATTYTDTNVIAGTIYYYTAFPYDNRTPMNINFSASNKNTVTIEYY